MEKKLTALFFWACVCLCCVACVFFAGCAKQEEGEASKGRLEEWEQEAELLDHATSEELYRRALEENTLMVYSVTSRIFDVKKGFEEAYPGLTVTIKDMRGDDVVDMLKSNFAKGDYACDLVLCSDCNGSLYKELLEPGIVYPYVPWDIAGKMKEGAACDGLEFMGETMMLFYNEALFDEPPIQNIWELTDSGYKGQIIMANPLKSFSTYEFCVALGAEQTKMEQAYEAYFGTAFEELDGKSAGEVFWELAARNITFTNSSDEVTEGIGRGENTGYKIGIMLSSKMRYQELGYHITPIYQLEPFAAVYTPNRVTIAGGAKNVHAAKLFIRYMMGEADGRGEGRLPFSTIGTWSTRTDVADGNPVPLSDIDVIYPNKEYIYESREGQLSFWERLLEQNNQQE